MRITRGKNVRGMGGRRMLVGAAALGVAMMAAVPGDASGSPGDLDPGFGGAAHGRVGVLTGFGVVTDMTVQRDGKIVAAQTMRANLSCDHRILNGVEGARFLAEVKALLENPVALVLG